MKLLSSGSIRLVCGPLVVFRKVEIPAQQWGRLKHSRIEKVYGSRWTAGISSKRYKVKIIVSLGKVIVCFNLTFKTYIKELWTRDRHGIAYGPNSTLRSCTQTGQFHRATPMVLMRTHGLSSATGTSDGSRFSFTVQAALREQIFTSAGMRALTISLII